MLPTGLNFSFGKPKFLGLLDVIFLAVIHCFSFLKPRKNLFKNQEIFLSRHSTFATEQFIIFSYLFYMIIEKYSALILLFNYGILELFSIDFR